MATQAELVATTRRLVAEASGTFFSDPVLLAHLNAALAAAIDRIVEIAPAEFRRRATADISVGVDGTRSRYERPTSENVRMYEIRTSIGTAYRQMERLIKEQTVVRSGDIVSFTDGTVRSGFGYYVEGHELVIVPEPAANVTAGLRCTYTEVQVLSADGDVPYIPVTLHRLLAVGAAIYAIGESKDAADSVVDRWRGQWAAKFGSEDGSTQESRASLAATYRVHEPRALVGMRL